MKIAIVSGSPRKLSKTIHVMSHVHDYLNNKSYHFKKHQPLYLTDDLNYKNGKREGRLTNYSGKGQIVSEWNFKDGLEDV